jgi:hypothetical protein
VNYRLALPIQDNRRALVQRFPGARYGGDVGDPAHMTGTGDHTPYGTDVIWGQRNHPGVIYAQDFSGGADFDLVEFTRWLLTRLRLGFYPEVKYVISRLEPNKGVAGGRFYGLFDRRYGWRTQRSTGHTEHVHVSYMPGAASTPSQLVEDFYRHLQQQASEDDPMSSEEVLTVLQGVKAELAALNDYLMTGKRYGKAATSPPDSEYIGVPLKLLQSLDDGVRRTNDLLATLAGLGELGERP